MSKVSLIGRAGMSVAYQQYNFLKVWWQGALLVFVVLLLLFWLQGAAERKFSKSKSNLYQIIAVVVALIGLYFTYSDFRHSLSHRFLGERFHLGAYLFWIGWILISLFYLARKRTDESMTIPTTPGID